MSKEKRFKSTFENLECDHRQLLASGAAMKTLNIRDPPSSAALAAAWSTGSTRSEKGQNLQLVTSQHRQHRSMWNSYGCAFEPK